MKTHHWFVLLIVFILAYLVGVKYPSVGASALSKIGM